MPALFDLSVPDVSARPSPEVELHPGKVEKWLASLPLLNLAAGGHQLYSTLHAYNRIDIDPAQRLTLLELYRAPIKHIVLELQKQYVDLPLPLPDKYKSAAEQNREFQREMAYGYKHVVLAHAELTRPSADTVLALHRAIRHLTETLLASYLSYSPFPTNLWREIHAVYAHAERVGVTAAEVDDPLNGVRGKSSAAEAYKQALLLDLSDPYHLPSRMTVKINQYLESYAELASLHRRIERVEPNCHFLIDLESDRAGIVYSNEIVLERAERYCLLNTLELARHIHLQLTQLRDGKLPASAALPSGFYKSGGEEMLRRLINVWGINPKRTFRRSQRQNAKVDVAIGLDAVNYWFNGGRRFTLTADLVGPFPPTGNTGDGPPKQDQTPPSADYEYTSWEVQDESAGGMSLHKNGVWRRRVKIGDLIATRSSRTEGWIVAVVRWIKSPNSSNVEIGTQRLAPAATAVLVKVMSDSNQESDFLPALLLPAVAALNEPSTLITPRNVFRPNRTIYMDDGRRLSRLVAKELWEVTNAFERIEFIRGSA